MIGKRPPKGTTEETKPMRAGRTMAPKFQADADVDATFRKIRGAFRIVLWLASASLVMTFILFISVFFMSVHL